MENSKNVVLPVVLNGNNYLLWSRTTKTALRSKGLWDHILSSEFKGKDVIVDGGASSPSLKSGGKTDEEVWEQDDQLVLSVLQNSLDPSILAAYSYSETAKDLWDTLKGVFGNLSNLSRIFEVKKALNDLKQEGKSFKELFGEFRSLWAEMEMLRPSSVDPTVLLERKEQDQVFGLLLTLDDSFKDLIKHILRYTTLPSLNEVCLAIQKEEGSRSLLKIPSDSAHYGNESQSRGTYGERKDLFCNYCKKKGHTKERCWTLHPDLAPVWFHKSDPNEPKKVANMAKEEKEEFVKKSDFEALIKSINKLTEGKSFFAKPSKPLIIDSGASHNMISDSNLLENLRPHSGKVCVANGDSVNIEGIGDLNILDGKTKALFMPKFTNNLLSVFKTTSDLDCKVIFDSNGVVFQDKKTGITVGEGVVKDGLYMVNKNKVVANKEKGFIAELSPSRWHERLGHPHFKTLQLMVPNLSKELEGCEACILGKHHRSSFPDSSSSYESCFDLVHTDVWSSPCLTRDQYKYFVSFIDEKSKYTWVTLMSSKSQVVECFIRFHSYVSTQFGAKIKTLRSDNGGEYMNHQMKEFLEKHGIVHQTTCPYTPQQNGVAERKNRHLMEMSRTILFARGVPKTFWGDAVMTSTYLINRLPTPNLNNLSPYEILNGEKPKMDHLKVFGCVCYVHVPEGTRNKLEPRSIKCIFVGYSSTQKGWKCYNPETRRVYVSRDVKFDEESSYFDEKDWSKGAKLVQSTEDQAKRLKVLLEGLNKLVGSDHTIAVESSSDVVGDSGGTVEVSSGNMGDSQDEEEEEHQSMEESEPRGESSQETVEDVVEETMEETVEESPVAYEPLLSPSRRDSSGLRDVPLTQDQVPGLRRSTRIKYPPNHWKNTRVYYNNFANFGDVGKSSNSKEMCAKTFTSQVCEKILGKIGLRNLHQPILRRSVEMKRSHGPSPQGGGVDGVKNNGSKSKSVERPNIMSKVNKPNVEKIKK